MFFVQYASSKTARRSRQHMGVSCLVVPNSGAGLKENQSTFCLARCLRHAIGHHNLCVEEPLQGVHKGLDPRQTQPFAILCEILAACDTGDRYALGLSWVSDGCEIPGLSHGLWVCLLTKGHLRQSDMNQIHDTPSHSMGIVPVG